jgi:RNA polymerase sigma factor (sigma-70 family)
VPTPLLNDGYGDQPTVDETIDDYEAWLHHRAHQMLPPTDHRHDDLVQEGRIAIWQAYDRYEPGKGALPSWLTRHATWHMTETLSRRRWTGSPDRRAGRHVVQDAPTTSLEQLLAPGDDHPGDETAAGVTPDIADMAMEAYHRGDIHQALAELTDAQRRYVLLRFWGDASGPQLRDEFGYDPKGLWKTARGGAQLKLARALAHLESSDPQEKAA